MNDPFARCMIERVHPFFTASAHYPQDMSTAFEDGKARLLEALENQKRVVAGLTLADYCRATGVRLEDLQ